LTKYYFRQIRIPHMHEAQISRCLLSSKLTALTVCTNDDDDDDDDDL